MGWGWGEGGDVCDAASVGAEMNFTCFRQYSWQVLGKLSDRETEWKTRNVRGSFFLLLLVLG